jgi:uncharacterized RDD family membrane protein YckC
VSSASAPIIPGEVTIPPPGGDGELEPAGFGVRAGARVIDMVIHNVVAVVVTFGLAFVVAIYAAIAQVPGQELIERLGRMTVLSILAALVASVAYHWVAEGLHGSSPGKMILGLAVLSEDGQPCGSRAALLRSLAFFVDGLVFGVPAYTSMRDSPQQQRYGDKWARTIVVRRRSVPAAHLRSTLRFNLALLLALTSYSAIFIAGMLLKLRP